MGIIKRFYTYYLIAAAGVVQAQVGERWALVLPFDATQSDRGSATNFVARDFFTGFKLGLEENSRPEWPIQLDIYDFHEDKLTLVDDLGAESEPQSAADFMAEQSALGVRFVIGPFRSKDSELLASYADSSVFVVNPLSRDVDVQSRPQLIAASPSRNLEYQILGRLLAQEVAQRPNWINIVFCPANPSSTLQRRALWNGFHELGGDTALLKLRSFENSTSITDQVKNFSGDSARFILFDESMYSNAVLLNALSKRPADATEFWSQSSVVNNPSVDAFLLLRQNVVWAQSDRLEYADHYEIEEVITKKLGDSNSRWAWLGYDLAQMLLNDNPASFSGPKRTYLWRQHESGGQYNDAVSLYRYTPETGVNPVALPVLPKVE